ncbi:hypothetical protein JZO86_00235 [Enterococcus ureasiticus]|uniref:hypothetical protein n=1 Tax=Enterococcus ureasiticus TaxID=903984 RepID=UPI001A8FF4D5|nr:hypothetical protein [Enterococcus ureasiticus]MBO0472140.1 hypothetical protein [Enterococcus ureasiticus]
MKKMDNTTKNKHSIIYIKNIFYRSMKIRRRKLGETIYSDVSTLMFFFFEFLLLYLLNIFRLASNSIEKSINNSTVDDIQVVNTETDLKFLLLTIKIGLLIMIVGLIIFGIFRFFIYLIQKIIAQKDDIETKLLLGATPTYISFEIVIEVCYLIPIFLILGYLLAGIFINKFLYLLMEMFPIGSTFRNGLHIFSIVKMFSIVLGIMCLFAISILFVKKRILKIVYLN